MKVPVIEGIIDRRILANFHIDPEVMAKNLPAPFRPKLVSGYAIGGICLIRLIKVRPKFLPIPCGLSSENAAHRIAVEWDQDGESKEGVYIPRRDSNSRLSTLAGGSIFPGVHHFAQFDIKETPETFSITMLSKDGQANVHVSGSIIPALPEASVFENLAAASKFFELGSLGYSDTGKDGRYDGLELRCQNWHCDSMEIDKIESSYFLNEAKFPAGSVEFDCALLMRGIDHEWHAQADLCCS